MRLKILIQNWKLNLLALICILFLTSLGCWQLSRAHEKQNLIRSFAARNLEPPLTSRKLQQQTDLRFYQATLTGHFDNSHTFLLDNKIVHGKIGYEIYTPFYANGLTGPILIDRGFVGIQKSRTENIAIKPIKGQITLTGLLNQPPQYLSLGNLFDGPVNWPLRIEYLNTKELAKILRIPRLFNYILVLPPKDNTFVSDLYVTTITPERHKGYAVQWFALALTLLILSTALNWRSQNIKQK